MRNKNGKFGKGKLPKSFRKLLKVPHLTVRGKNHFRWKGNMVSYSGLHKWVKSRLGNPRICENCCKKGLRLRQYHWCNISGKYKRELTDWVRLCAKCHKAFDTGKIQL